MHVPCMPFASLIFIARRVEQGYRSWCNAVWYVLDVLWPGCHPCLRTIRCMVAGTSIHQLQYALWWAVLWGGLVYCHMKVALIPRETGHCCTVWSTVAEELSCLIQEGTSTASSFV